MAWNAPKPVLFRKTGLPTGVPEQPRILIRIIVLKIYSKICVNPQYLTKLAGEA